MATTIRPKIEDLEKKVKGFKKPKSYKKGNFMHSNIYISPEEKDSKEYMMPWVEYIYSLFQKRKTWMGTDYNSIEMMRSYMEGNQPTDQYKDWLYGANTTNQEQTAFDSAGFDVRDTKSTPKSDRVAWVNIDEQPLSIGPKIMAKLLEQARGVYYEMGVNAIDSMSAQTEDLEEARLWFEKENQEYMKAQRAILGITQQEPDFMPINVQELELYKLSGGFKVPYALAMELLLKHTFNISEFDKEVKEKILKDLSSIRYTMVREYYCKEEQRIKVKWVDPELGFLQYSKDHSYKNSEIGGELERWKISKVRKVFDLTFEEAAALAFFYSGEMGNPNASMWDTYGHYTLETGGCGFDFYDVPVFRCEFIDIDNERYYKHITANGNVFNKPLKNKDTEGKMIYDSPRRYVREATWIPGTNYLTEYGKLKFIPRPNRRVPRISYRGVRLGTPALFQQIRPLLNGLTQSWWKTQEAIAISISNGIAVDVGALKNISIGKDKSWDVLEIIKYYRQRAVLFHKRTNPMGFGAGGGSSPITILQTNMERNVIAQFDMMDKFMAMIESISGINLISTGGTPEPRVGKFNMQVALKGTDQIIGSVIRAATELQADVGVNCMSRIRGLLKGDPSAKKSYEGVVGKEQLKTVLMAEKNNVEYGLSIEARDVSAMVSFIEEVLAASIKAAGGESGLLDASEVILIRDMVEQKQNMRLISLTLGYILRKKGKEAELEKLRAIEAQGQQLQKVEQEKQRNADKERQFEMFKMKKQFEYDYKLKWGQSPGELMEEAVNSTPPEARGAPQGEAPQPPAEPQSQGQPQMV